MFKNNFEKLFWPYHSSGTKSCLDLGLCVMWLGLLLWSHIDLWNCFRTTISFHQPFFNIFWFFVKLCLWNRHNISIFMSMICSYLESKQKKKGASEFRIIVCYFKREIYEGKGFPDNVFWGRKGGCSRQIF